MSGKHPFLKHWLCGTTCAFCGSKALSVMWENEEWIVLKHASHASYINRVSGNTTCRSYAKLFRKDVFLSKGDNAVMYGNIPFEKMWTGRISKQKVREECLQMGIIFPDQPLEHPVEEKVSAISPASSKLLKEAQEVTTF